jgi:hypothetical protein
LSVFRLGWDLDPARLVRVLVDFSDDLPRFVFQIEFLLVDIVLPRNI